MNKTKTFMLLVVVLLMSLVVANVLAAVTFDPVTGTGFVGKGDVQNAFGWNNAQLQANAGGVSFMYTQQVTQAVTQSLTQLATQSATQSVSQTLSCTVETRMNTFSRDGSRSGLRTGLRDGSRTGSRTGTVSGAVTNTIGYDARSRNQINGFNLTGYGGSTSTYGEPTWSEATWSGDYSWGDYSWGETTWSNWIPGPDNEPSNASPETCWQQSGNVTDLSDVTTPGAVVEGNVENGAVQEGNVTYGDITVNSAALYVKFSATSVLLQ